VSPHLARNTDGTLDEARRLWQAVARESFIIKVPATPEKIPAVEQLISEGINVSATPLFSQDEYERIARAKIAGLEKRSAQGQPLDHVVSVPSFFISRIDLVIDKLLEEKFSATGSSDEKSLLQSLMGKVAIAKLSYQVKNREIQISENREAVSRAAAELLVNLALEALRSKKSIAVALSGGSTPKTMFWRGGCFI
jgi:transaldolase/glucose-6-phosphate isomerase